MWEMCEVCGKRPGSCNEAVKKAKMAKMGAEMNSIDIVILVFIMFEKSKIALKNRNLFDIIYKGKLRDEVICNGGCIMAEERIKVNYKPLWKLLIDRDISKGDLRRDTKIAASTFTKMMNNENVSLDVLVRICVVLNCGLDDIVEIEK